jgi:phosphatidylserine synthase
LKRFIASIATLGNATCGMVGMMKALDPASTAWQVVPWFALGLVLDGLDGPLARRLGSVRLGSAFDAAADLITYGGLPAALIATHGAGGAWLAAPYFLAVFVRLVLFVLRPPAGSYRGLPTSVAAPTILLLATLRTGLWLDLTGLCLGLLMLSPIRYPKLRGRRARLLAPLALAALTDAVLLVWPATRIVGAAFGLAVCAAVIFASPLLVGTPAANVASVESKT